MAVNNETGAVNPIDEIAAYVKKNSRAYMHVDMTTTYSNSIYPGNYIDVYLKAAIKDGNGGDSKVNNNIEEEYQNELKTKKEEEEENKNKNNSNSEDKLI